MIVRLENIEQNSASSQSEVRIASSSDNGHRLASDDRQNREVESSQAGTQHSGSASDAQQAGSATQSANSTSPRAAAAAPQDSQGNSSAGTQPVITLQNAADTLSQDTIYTANTAIDSLRFWEVSHAIDTLPAHSWHNASAEELFGQASTVAATDNAYLKQPAILAENSIFQGFVLALAVAYSIFIARNLLNIRTLLTRISRDKSSGERMIDEPGNGNYLHFLNVATVIGLLFTGLIAVRYGGAWVPTDLVALIPRGAAITLSLVTTLACVAVIVFQWILLKLIGAVTLTQPFIAQIILLKRTYFSLATVIASPVLLLIALCPPGKSGILLCIFTVELLVAAILYLREVLNLFILKKISILNWILYLCGVEVFPISLLWLLMVRLSGN